MSCALALCHLASPPQLDSHHIDNVLETGRVLFRQVSPASKKFSRSSLGHIPGDVYVCIGINFCIVIGCFFFFLSHSVAMPNSILYFALFGRRPSSPAATRSLQRTARKFFAADEQKHGGWFLSCQLNFFAYQEPTN